MANPQIQQVVQKVDEFLAGYPTLFQYDKLRDLEKKTGQPKAYFFVGIVGVIFSAIYAMGGMKLMTDLFGFAYPAYMSFKAIESSETIDDTQWLTYWVVFGFFSIAENVMSFLIEWIPFYYMIKCAFFLWLYHPKFLGAGLMYKQLIKPYVMPALERTQPAKKQE
jgi:receptor expression-enhancing protein 5/6